MKYNPYNSLFTYIERCILHNFLTRKLLVLDRGSKELLNKAKNDISILEPLNQKLYKTVLEKDIWVDDEFKLIRSDIMQERNGSQKYQLTICHTINGYTINQKHVSLFQKNTDYTCLQITLGESGDLHNKNAHTSSLKETYDAIITDIIMLVNNNINVKLKINYTPDNIYNCSKILKRLSHILSDNTSKLSISFHCIGQKS